MEGGTEIVGEERSTSKSGVCARRPHAADRSLVVSHPPLDAGRPASRSECATTVPPTHHPPTARPAHVPVLPNHANRGEHVYAALPASNETCICDLRVRAARGRPRAR